MDPRRSELVSVAVARVSLRAALTVGRPIAAA